MSSTKAPTVEADRNAAAPTDGSASLPLASNSSTAASLSPSEPQNALLRGRTEQNFGRLYAELAGPGPRELSYAAQRARMLLRVRQGLPKPSLWSRSWLWIAALETSAGRVALGAIAVGAVAAALALTLNLGADSLVVEWQGVSVASDTRLVTHAEEAPLDFSDGSRIVLQPNAVAKLGRVSAKEADVTLEDGSVVANIKKQTGVHWTIGAGPYQVHVIGTRFAVDWDKDDGHFHVAVTEGIVRVSGGNLPDDGIRLIAGSELTRDSKALSVAKDTALGAPPSGQENTVEHEAVAQEDAAQEDAMPEPKSGDPWAASEASEARTVRRAAPPLNEAPLNEALPSEPAPAEVTSWQTLANAGDYRGALAAAEAAGFDSLVQSGGADDLLLLANSARYARSGQRAKQAYSAIRQRFPGSHAARLAAFYLARLAGDVEGQPRAEANWLKTYLSEAPSGELAASARARLMETLRGLGDSAGASAVARDYLKFHPAGPHAELARTVLRGGQERP